MRHVWPCAVLCALGAVTGYTKSSDSPDQTNRPPLTIVLDFRGLHATHSVEAMEREVAGILRGTGRAIEWRSWEEASGTSFEELTVVRFDGNCGVPPWPRNSSVEGPLGITHISDREVLPFSDISCAQIANSVGPAMLRMEPAQAETVFGRAMGRVVAHELIHMISRSTVHGHEGVTQPALSESQLTGERLDLSAKDLLRVFGRERR